MSDHRRRCSRPHAATAGAALALALVCLGSSLPAAGARQLPDGPTAGAAKAQAAAMQHVVVTMRGSLDLDDLPNLGRSQRLRAVIRALQAHAEASQASVRARLRALEAQGEVTSQTSLWIANAISVTASASAVRELANRSDVASVVPDEITVLPTSVPVEPNIAAVHAPDVWAAGRTGQGVVVATLDTGVDLANPDLAARWRGGNNSWFDPYGQHPAGPVDLDGHGTATAGLVVGGSDGGSSYGMAPGASLIAARVFDDRGAVTTTALHQAFQWVLDPDHDPGTSDAPRVVNGSWVLGAGPSCNLTLQPDVQALRAAGILPVFSAGNFGPTTASSSSPANYPEALSVGAVDASDVVWVYSASGPSSCGGRARGFPDLVAPGVSVRSADRFGGYQYVTGTSVAAPHVAGAAALLAGAHPGLQVSTLETALTATAADLGPAGIDDRYGHGRLDVVAAEAWAASAPDFALSAAPQQLTVAAGGSVSSAVTVQPFNGYAEATTLSVQGLPSGSTWSFTPSVLGGGSWASTLNVTTTKTLGPGFYPLTITASGGGVTRSVSAILSVTAAPDFSVSASPTSLSIKRGQSATSTVTVGSVGGFTGSVGLSTSTLPTGMTSTWTGAPVAAPGSASLRLAVTSRTKTGTYSIVVTASAGGSTHTTTVSVRVT